MGCSCRGAKSKPTSSRFVTPKVEPSSSRSLCVNLESSGNSLTIKIGSDGRLRLGNPEMPVSSLLTGTGCNGAFAKAILVADAKLAHVYMSPASKARFQDLLPGPNVKLGFLRDMLKNF